MTDARLQAQNQPQFSWPTASITVAGGQDSTTGSRSMSTTSSSDDDDDGSEHPTKTKQQRVKFKIVLIGDAAVGKTAIARGLAAGSSSQFCAEHHPTVGVEFYKQELRLAANVHVTLQLWDTGSRVSSLQMAANYCQGCDAILLVHDVTAQHTHTVACEWLDVVHEMFAETGLPLVAMVANKADTAELQEQEQMRPAAAAGDVEACCPRSCHYCVSAKTGHGLQQMARSVASQLAGVPLSAAADEEAQLDLSPVATPAPLPHVKRRWAQRLVQWCCWCCSDGSSSAAAAG